jgi:hypothetical protein
MSVATQSDVAMVLPLPVPTGCADDAVRFIDMSSWPKFFAEWGYAVVKLGPLAQLTGIHPMALEFPRRDPERVFFPTVHVHDGEVHPRAKFDHQLYCQDVEGVRRNHWYRAVRNRSPWVESSMPLKDVAFESVKEILRVDQPCYRTELEGMHPNEDIVI